MGTPQGNERPCPLASLKDMVPLCPRSIPNKWIRS